MSRSGHEESEARMTHPLPESVDATLEVLSAGGYVGDRSLATALFLALKLGRPLFLEGEAGGGKTETAKVLATTPGRPLVGVQGHDGLGVRPGDHDWYYPSTAEQTVAPTST